VVRGDAAIRFSNQALRRKLIRSVAIGTGEGEVSGGEAATFHFSLFTFPGAK